MITVIKYYADWCTPCKAMEPTWAKAQVEFKDIVVFQNIDIDNNPQQTKDANVRTIPTIVAYEEGKELGRHNSLTYPELEEWLNGLSGNI